MAHNVEIKGEVATLTLSGDIDLQYSGDIKSEIERLRDVDRLQIVASEVSYIDSSGVAVLILARQFCAQNNITLALPSISEAVHRVLQLAKLDVMLPIGEVVSAPEPEEFSFDAGTDSFDSNPSADSDFGSDDDLVSSLLADDDMATGTAAAGDGVGADGLAGDGLAGNDLSSDDQDGDFGGLDVAAVDFSEPAATAMPQDATDEELDPLPDSDAMKPGTFS